MDTLATNSFFKADFSVPQYQQVRPLCAVRVVCVCVWASCLCWECESRINTFGLMVLWTDTTESSCLCKSASYWPFTPSSQYHAHTPQIIDPNLCLLHTLDPSEKGPPPKPVWVPALWDVLPDGTARLCSVVHRLCPKRQSKAYHALDAVVNAAIPLLVRAEDE